MATQNNSISPQLEQALDTVVDKRLYQNALKALELAEGDKEALEAAVQRFGSVAAQALVGADDREKTLKQQQQQDHIQIIALTNKNVELEKKVEELEISLGLRPPGSTLDLPPNVGVGAMLREGPPRR